MNCLTFSWGVCEESTGKIEREDKFGQNCSRVK